MDSSQFREAAKGAIDESTYPELPSIWSELYLMLSQSPTTTIPWKRDQYYQTSNQATSALYFQMAHQKKANPGTRFKRI
jgi:hypothetical protein